MKPATVAEDRADFLARSVSPSARRAVGQAFAGKCSAMAAIKAKCLDCAGYDRAEIAACAVVRCPLHAFRPFRPPGDGREKVRRVPKSAVSERFSGITAPGPSTTPSASADGR